MYVLYAILVLKIVAAVVVVVVLCIDIVQSLGASAMIASTWLDCIEIVVVIR